MGILQKKENIKMVQLKIVTFIETEKSLEIQNEKFFQNYKNKSG